MEACGNKCIEFVICNWRGQTTHSVCVDVSFLFAQVEWVH